MPCVVCAAAGSLHIVSSARRCAQQSRVARLWGRRNGRQCRHGRHARRGM